MTVADCLIFKISISPGPILADNINIAFALLAYFRVPVMCCKLR